MDELMEAYRSTAFWFETPDEYLCIRVGHHSPELDEVLDHHRVQSWAYVTACNPGSRKLSPRENNERQSQLWEGVRGSYIVYPGVGVGRDADWPPEKSLMIIGISEEEARLLGKQYGQNAIVVGRRGEAAELLVISSMQKRA